MKKEWIYDLHAMLHAEREAAGLLREIRRKAGLLDARMSANLEGRSRQTDSTFRSLQEVCAGYEKLLHYLHAAAGLYGMAEERALEEIDF